MAQQDPLAQLEELLAKAKGQRGQDSAAPSDPPGPSPEEIAAQQKAEAEEALKQQEATAEAQRAVALEQVREQMHDLADTPQDRARKEQDEQKKAEKQAQSEQMQGFEIRQITNTKI